MVTPPHQRTAVILIVVISFLGCATCLTSSGNLCPVSLSACNCSAAFGNESVSCDVAQDSNSCCSERIVVVNETICCKDTIECTLCIKVANCSSEPCWVCNSTLPSCNTSTTSGQPNSTAVTTKPCPDKAAPYLTPDNGRCVAKCGFIGIMKPDNMVCRNMVLAYVIDSLICVGIPLIVIVITVVSIVCCRKKHGKCQPGRRNSDDDGPMDLKPLPSKNELGAMGSSGPLKHITNRTLSVKNDYLTNRVQDEWRYDHIQSDPDYGQLPVSQDPDQEVYVNQQDESDDSQENYTPMDNFQAQQRPHPASQRWQKSRATESAHKNPVGNTTKMGYINTLDEDEEEYQNFSTGACAEQQRSSPATSNVDLEEDQEIYENQPATSPSNKLSLVDELKKLTSSFKFRAPASPSIPERPESTLEDYSEVTPAQDTRDQSQTMYYAGRQSDASMESNDSDIYQNWSRNS